VAKLGRPGMSDEMKADLWRRWRSGESISVISRQIGKPPGSVLTVLKHHGGIAPAPRRARAGSLTLSEREEISRGLCAGHSYRAIAGLLGRAVSTISREVGNNGGRDVYRAIAAQERALDRARRPKPCLLAARPALRRALARHLGRREHLSDIVQAVAGLLSHQQTADLSPARQT
jgi:DNA-binding CsgD family transcriptional regulator